jgi:hypothetical protein
VTSTVPREDTVEPQITERSVPKPRFTDAEAGARTFPDSGPGAAATTTSRRQAQADPLRGRDGRGPADPRHYLTRAGSTGSPTASGATRCTGPSSRPGASTEPAPQRGVGTGGMAKGLHLAGARLAPVPGPERGVGQTLYRYNANVVRQLTQNIENARNGKSFAAWSPNWVHFVETPRGRLDAHRAHPRAVRLRGQRALGADEHAQHRAGREQRAQDPLRAGPGAVQPHPHRGDRGLRRHGSPRGVELRRRVAGRPQGLRGADRDPGRLGRGRLRDQRGVRAADRRAVPQQPRDAVGRPERRLRHPRP